MKLSVCITTFNEEKSISDLINSLLVQTKKPDEIVIVDGGSTDDTVRIIRHLQKKDNKIKLLIEKGSIAKGRNIAIDLAKGPLIASIDAGCVAKADWLEKLTEIFKHENVGISAGFYEMPAVNSLQRAVNMYIGIIPEKYDPITFIPSTRSVVFKKSIWEEIGGFSEKLGNTAEDTKFFSEAVKRGVKISNIKEAIVEWRDTKENNLSVVLKKMFMYAKGDAKTGIWRHPQKGHTSHNIKVVKIILRYLVGITFIFAGFKNNIYWLAILGAFFVYSIISFLKVYKYTKEIKSSFWGVVLRYSSDFAVMAGFVKGIYEK